MRRTSLGEIQQVVGNVGLGLRCACVMHLGITYEEMEAEVLRINGNDVRAKNVGLGLTVFWGREGGGEPVKVTENEVKKTGGPDKCSALKLGSTGYIIWGVLCKIEKEGP